MPQAGFELAIQASDQPQKITLDRSATGIGNYEFKTVKEHNIHIGTENP
jgi:hypothetical protein